MPTELERIIAKCLEKDPELRYQSARDLMADLKRLRRDVTSGPSEVQPADIEPAVPRRRNARLSLRAGIAALAVLVGWWMFRARQPHAPGEAITITPFTTDSGGKFFPRLSPDGEKVAYAWAGPGDDNWDVYVKAVGQGTKPLRITEDPAVDWSPTWSPDGRQIAFVRVSADKTAAIYTVPSLGGQERRLVDVTGSAWAGDQDNYFVPMLCWAPDGEWLAFAEKASVDTPARIVRLSLATLEKRPLTSPPMGSVGDFSPRSRRMGVSWPLYGAHPELLAIRMCGSCL